MSVALAGALAGAGIEATHGAELAASTHAAFWVIVALGLAIVTLGISSTSAGARASAQRVAALLG